MYKIKVYTVDGQALDFEAIDYSVGTTTFLRIDLKDNSRKYFNINTVQKFEVSF